MMLKSPFDLSTVQPEPRRDYHEHQLWQCRAALRTLRNWREWLPNDDYEKWRLEELDSAAYHRRMLKGA